MFLFASNGMLESLGSDLPGQIGNLFGMQSDGKVIAHSYDGLKRYNTDLSVDPGFHSEGWTQLRATGILSGSWQPVMQADDKMLITSVISGQLNLARLDSDGTVDSGYANPVVPDVVRIFGADPNGRLVVQGSSAPSPFPPCVARVHSFTGVYLGTLFDASTSASGNLCGSDYFSPHPNGGLVWSVAGTPMRIYRSNGNSGLDNTFGVSGTVPIPLPTGWRWFFGLLPVAVQGDGKVVAVMSVTSVPEGQAPAGHINPLVARFNVDGSPDTAFGSQGYFIAAQNIDDRISEILALPDGKILIVGISAGKLVMMRFAGLVVHGVSYLPFAAINSN
jgi:uncharacterized delta-60 repeat protein